MSLCMEKRPRRSPAAAITVSVLLLLDAGVVLIWPTTSYYAKLIPLTLPVLTGLLYVSWLGLQVFKTA